jgi:hypothetical protein
LGLSVVRYLIVQVDQITYIPKIPMPGGAFMDKYPPIIGNGFIPVANKYVLVADIHPQPVLGRCVSAKLPIILSGGRSPQSKDERR